jgi:hypothetical protein
MDISIPTLVAQAVPILALALPTLLHKTAEGGASEAGKRLTGAGWDLAHGLWGKLAPKVENDPATLQIIEQVAAAPEDADAEAMLRFQLRRMLEADPSLSHEVAQFLQQHAGATTVTNVTASGERSIGIGGNVIGGSIQTGDQSLHPSEQVEK